MVSFLRAGVVAGSLTIFELYLILAGVLSPADPGVLERVAETRAVCFGQVEDWRDYEVLTAVQDCRLVGETGWLIANGDVYTAIVIDCEADVHRGQMAERGLMADANMESLGHLKGWLVLR